MDCLSCDILLSPKALIELVFAETVAEATWPTNDDVHKSRLLDEHEDNCE